MSPKPTTSLRWTPIRKGNIFCSPACGGKCTFAAYQLAKTNGDKLAKELGKNWKGRVWENLGWHYKAVLKGMDCNVHCHGDASYWADLNFGGTQFEANRESPSEAVNAALAKARAVIAEASNFLLMFASKK